MSTSVYSQPPLDTCAQEPIRIPGGIQPHGALLVLSHETLQILQASANARATLDSAFAGPGHSLVEACGAVLAGEVKKWLIGPDRSFLRTAAIKGRSLQVLGHRNHQGVLLEFEEPPTAEGETLEGLYPRIGHFMEDVEHLADVNALCAAAAREFRGISGFNRVLIYRFDADWHGEVLAEEGDGVLPSYLGLRFPASDIPAQARDLYRLNRLRLIPDANYAVVPLEPQLSPMDGQPLDLSFAALRSVSPVHLEYMRNMGTLASMSISLMVDGKLWGLVSCHNAEPRRVNAQARTACDLLGRVLSQQIGARDRGAYAARRIELKRFESGLLAELTAAETLAQGLKRNEPAWLGLASATGAALIHDGAIHPAGITPPVERIQALADRVRLQGAPDSFATEALGERWPEFQDIAGVASGVLAVSVSQLHTSYVLWFRAEVVRTLNWAGDPNKPMAADNGRLHPRHSFATWQELVRGRAQPWTRAELDAANDFRSAMINVVLRRAEERAELTSQLQRSNHELESFSYSVSHDLRAPFRHIVGYTQLLRDRERTLSKESQHYLDSIGQAASTAGQLVDDLLSFSQLGRTELRLAPVDMDKLLQEVLRTLAPDTRDRQIVWQIKSLPPAQGDAALLRQALVNLIGNAIKYTRDRLPAVISISGGRERSDCTYTVQDNGVGFEMSYVHKLFGVFQRLHRMEEFEGTGIGLALTKRIIERHGGWITAQGEPGEGATFVFGLPSKPMDAVNA
jgi:two-component system, chemotaxis family, sensor kinase Cph1